MKRPAWQTSSRLASRQRASPPSHELPAVGMQFGSESAANAPSISREERHRKARTSQRQRGAPRHRAILCPAARSPQARQIPANRATFSASATRRARRRRGGCTWAERRSSAILSRLKRRTNHMGLHIGSVAPTTSNKTRPKAKSNSTTTSPIVGDRCCSRIPRDFTPGLYRRSSAAQPS